MDGRAMYVPAPYVDAFTSLARLDMAEFDRLTAALQAAQPTIQIDDLTDSVYRALGDPWSRNELLAVLGATTSLSSVRRANDWTASEVGERIAWAPNLELSDEERSTLHRRVEDVVSVTCVALLGKAVDLATEHDKVYIASQSVTDLRPLFGDDPELRPTAALLSHTLKLEYIHDDGRVGNIYLVLDDEDVSTLIEDLERALAKSRSMRSMLEDSGMLYLGPAPENRT